MKLIQLILLLSGTSLAQSPDPVAYWSFDQIRQTETVKPMTRKGLKAPEIYRNYTLIETVKGSPAGRTLPQVVGAFHKSVPGVVGNALQLDGNTSFVEVAPVSLSGDFSVGAWVALGAYPTHWCPIADQNVASGKGFFLGIDALGHAGFRAFVGGNWVEVQGADRIPLRQWTQLQGVFSPADGLTLYVNGKPAASTKTTGDLEPAINVPLLIGKSSTRQKPAGTVRPNATEAVNTFFDGLIDELMIYDNALSASQVSEYVRKTATTVSPALPARSLPLAGAKAGKFGAIYTTLPYYEAWDKLWPVNGQADVVVQFDNSPAKFVFWHGTSYIPHWITENGIWYNNEFLETWSAKGSHEPMSDKRCEFSHVRVLESSDARVVVHWRYALIDNFDNQARVDTLTGFGEWADEVYTIYPDGIGTRTITLHSSQPQSAHEWHEGIVVMGPGQRPEQVLQPGALTLANMKGETHTYSWQNGIPPEAGKDGYINLPAGANIHVVNTNSTLKPFTIIAPAANPIWDIYHGELRREVSLFPWWNHWPAAQKASDGRYAMDADYASHSSLSHASWEAYAQTENSMTKVMLHGLTAGKPADWVALAQSWSNPARLKLNSVTGFSGGNYDPTERAYQVRCTANNAAKPLTLTLEGSTDSPIENPALVVKGWGNRPVSLLVDGKPVPRGKTFRYGYRDSLEGTDLVVWLEKKATQPTAIVLTPGKN
jgi:hypothetical protein